MSRAVITAAETHAGHSHSSAWRGRDRTCKYDRRTSARQIGGCPMRPPRRPRDQPRQRRAGSGAVLPVTIAVLAITIVIGGVVFRLF
jgi:hypothetical protein